MGGKLKASLLLVAMFLLGALAGSSWQTYRFQRRMLHPALMSRGLQRLQKELQLTPRQTAAIQDIFDKAHERARQVNEEVSWDLSDIHHDSVQAIRQILTPEQRREFERLHRRAHRAAHHPMEASELAAEAGS